MEPPLTVSLDKPTIWRLTIRDLAALVVFLFIAGTVYAGLRFEIAALHERNRRADEQATRTEQTIEKLSESVAKLAVAVGKLEGRLEAK